VSAVLRKRLPMFTAGPWTAHETETRTAIKAGKRVVAYVQISVEQDDNARLIASAPDHALIAAAIVAGVARWEFFTGDRSRGEICVGGLRYSSKLDEFGVPELNEITRAALSRRQA
jgi:hypothetical protein